jgi:hypothetical protein
MRVTMEITSDQIVTYPTEKVWETMRDRLPELVPFLSGVESIETTEREETGPGRVRLLNLWQGNKEAAPKAVRPFATRKMLRWKDHAEWDDQSHTVAWRFETYQFDKLFDCAGKNRFESTPENHTRLIIQGTLDVHANKIPGVPKFLARKIKPKIESFIVKLVGSNLTDLAKGLQGFLDQD